MASINLAPEQAEMSPPGLPKPGGGKLLKLKTTLRRGLLAGLGLATMFTHLLSTTVPAYASTPLSTAGYLDFSYSGTTLAYPTGEKPESKLWWNDGFWWGSLYNSAASQYHVYRLNWGTQTWEDTGVALDDRPTSKADVLWDAATGKLYVVSHLYLTQSSPTTNSANKGRLYRYSYNAAAQSYSLDNGFPVNVNNDKTETLVLDKDSNGRLWVAYVSRPSGSSTDYQVYVNTTTGPGLANDNSWGTPFSLGTLLLFPEAHVSIDDIASVIAFRDNGGDKIGVMWPNELTGNLNFATHADSNSNPQTDWSFEPVPIPSPRDDHMNLKKIPATGQLFAAIKMTPVNPADAQIAMVAREADGTWSFHPYSTKQDNDTRPILLIDEGITTTVADDQVYMFVAGNPVGREICYKTAVITTLLSVMSFPSGNCGTKFISDAAVINIDDATSTKQNVNSITGIVVMASDNTNGQFYVHNVLGDPPPVITARSPGFNAINVPVNAAVSVTFSKPINVSTLTTANFTVVNSDGPAAGTITYDSPTHTATFTPTILLRAYATYTATLMGGIQDMTGHALYDAPEVWSFTSVDNDQVLYMPLIMRSP